MQSPVVEETASIGAVQESAIGGDDFSDLGPDFNQNM